MAYCPLTPEEAGQCLEELITKIEVALNELHSYGFSHNDVRLPNVCCDNDYNAVLIDVDSCEDILVCPPTLSTALTGESCMYTRPTTIRAEEFTGEKMDYMQLGWLVVQVLTQSPSHHYHEMKWEDQPARIREDLFVSDLVVCGEYSKEYLSHSSVTRVNTNLLSSWVKTPYSI